MLGAFVAFWCIRLRSSKPTGMRLGSYLLCFFSQIFVKLCQLPVLIYTEMHKVHSLPLLLTIPLPLLASHTHYLALSLCLLLCLSVSLFLFLSVSLHTHFLNGTCTGTQASTHASPRRDANTEDTHGGTTISVTEVFLNETSKPENVRLSSTEVFLNETGKTEDFGPSSGESDEAPTFLISGGSRAQSFSREQAQVLSREGARKAEAVKSVLRMSATGVFTTTDLVTPVSEEYVPLPLPAGIVNTLLSPSFPPKNKPLSINRSSPQDPESPLPPTLSSLPQVSTCPPTYLPSIQIVRSLTLSLRNSSVPPNTESKRSNCQIPNPSYVFLRPTLNYTQQCVHH